MGESFTPFEAIASARQHGVDNGLARLGKEITQAAKLEIWKQLAIRAAEADPSSTLAHKVEGKFSKQLETGREQNYINLVAQAYSELGIQALKDAFGEEKLKSMVISEMQLLQIEHTSGLKMSREQFNVYTLFRQLRDELGFPPLKNEIQFKDE